MKKEDQRFEDAFDHIMRWFQNEAKYPLSDSLKGRLDRWKSAREFMLTHRPLTDSFVVNFLVQTYSVSEPQAWRDVRDTKRFFASMEKTNKEYERIMLMAQIRDLRAKAEQADNLKVAAQCDATLAKIGQFDQPDTDPGDAPVSNVELVIGFNPKLLGAPEIPNLLEQVEKFIGEKAKRELMMDDWIDGDGNKLS